MVSWPIPNPVHPGATRPLEAKGAVMKRFTLLAAVALVALALPADGLAQKTISGTITTDTTLDTVGGAIYEVTGSVTVNNGVTLTIEPGVVLKFYYHTGLTVHGTLTAAGGASQDSLIYFTSIKDDNAPAPFGDDTNGDGNATIPDNHDWRAIVFSEVSDPASRVLSERQTGPSVLTLGGKAHLSRQGSTSASAPSPSLPGPDVPRMQTSPPRVPAWPATR